MRNVVYYHYKGTPSDDDDCFRVLTELQKIQVTKLVAIVRVACSLDAGSNQKIDEIRLEEKDKELIVHVRTKENISLEWWTFNRDSIYFSEIFGIGNFLDHRGCISCLQVQSTILTVNYPG